ncbi:MAG: hypothetical protein WCW14_02435, partial [Candidatus Paceibacterota bacterium]
MKKILIIVLVCLVVVVGGGYYWWVGTPWNSLMQIKSALDKHETVTALKYFDTDSIFESLWAEGLAQIDTQVTTTSTSATTGRFSARLATVGGVTGVAEMTKPVAKQAFLVALNAGLSKVDTEAMKAKRQAENASSTLAEIFEEKMPSVVKNGDTATITTKKGVGIIMKQQSDRSWKISAITG